MLPFLKRYKDPLLLIAGLATYVLLAYVFGVPCPILMITGVSCPGCGMTRSLLSLCSLDFAAATFYHPLVWMIPVVTAAWILCRQRRWIIARQAIVCTAILLLIAVYVYRMWIDPSPVLQCAPQDGLIGQAITHLVQAIP